MNNYLSLRIFRISNVEKIYNTYITTAYPECVLWDRRLEPMFWVVVGPEMVISWAFRGQELIASVGRKDEDVLSAMVNFQIIF